MREMANEPYYDRGNLVIIFETETETSNFLVLMHLDVFVIILTAL